MSAPPRFAVLPPSAAAWFVAKLHGAGIDAAQVRAEAQWMRQCGHPTAASDLEAAWRQLVAARQDHRERVGVSARPSFEVESAPAGPAPTEASSRNQSMTTREAANMLGLTTQRVTQLLADGRLTGRKAGRLWVVDAASVDALADTRRAP